MDDFDLEIKREFINEALVNLEEAEGSFMELESSADPKCVLDKIFRLAHNLKGGSRAVGFGDVAEFTHQLENLVLKIQKGEVQLSSPVVTTLLRSNDRLVEMLMELKTNMSATFNNTDLLNDIQAWLDGKVAEVKDETPAAAPAEVPAVETPVETPHLELVAAPSEAEVSDIIDSLQSLTEEPVKPVEAVPGAGDFFEAEKEVAATPVAAVAPTPPKSEAKAPPSDSGKGKEKEDEIIRVSLSRIDLLNDYVGELIVLQSVIQQQVSQGTTGGQLHASLRQMVKLSKDIQNLSMSLRMLPVKPLIQKLQRVVRDTAKTLTKEVNLEVQGDQLDIDKSVLDRLADPLIHILRNAVDHGLETTEGRQKNGKSTFGNVKLSFSNEGNHLVVEVRDDGKGIDTEVVRKKAIEKRIIGEGQSLSEKQLLHLIFHPGFSTKSETSEISGRGVGMDVVKTNVEKIGGNVEIHTEIGKGSTFRIQIPLSLAVIEGLVVVSDTNRYVLPLGQVQETVNLRSQKLFHSKLGIGTCFELRGSVVPLFNIEESLGLKSQQQIDPSHTALIINVGDQLMALVVKDILRAQQIVIKPLGNGINPQKGWIGSCVLGDGSPALIVSPVDLLDGRVSKKIFEQTLGGAA